MTTSTRTEASAKKDVTKLQRAIVDGLEDVKAQDIQVFNTEKLSPLFERVIVASGTSNRQTKALASSVRDALREAGFAKPRTEGEDNGEWIIVDCGPAVVHIMQPAIRQYYHLEELWGGTPVRLKLGAAKPVATSAVAAKAEPKPAAKKAAKPKAPAKTLTPAEAKKAAKARREAEKPIAPQRPVLSPEPPVQMAAEKPSRRSVARKTAASKTTAPVKAAAKKAVVKTVVVKPIAKKPAAKKAPARKSAAKKA